MRVRFFIWLLVALTQVLLPLSASAQEDSAGEYEIKAAMLYNLFQFVEWPRSAYPAPQSPSILCVLGWDPFGKSLTALVSNTIIDGRPVQIRHVRNDESMRSCHVLYISSSERKQLALVLTNLSRASVLTVGEMSQFAARGGMVQFALEDKQVHFDINPEAASLSGLKISARLLALARIVKFQGRDSTLEVRAVALDASEISICDFRQVLLFSAEMDASKPFGGLRDEGRRR